jgi:hypothetical protein
MFALFDGVPTPGKQCHRGEVCRPLLVVLRLVYPGYSWHSCSYLAVAAAKE